MKHLKGCRLTRRAGCLPTAALIWSPACAAYLNVEPTPVGWRDWTVAVGLLSAIPYWFILRAECDSVGRRADSYHSTRLVLNLATYVIAFVFLRTIYVEVRNLIGSNGPANGGHSAHPLTPPAA